VTAGSPEDSAQLTIEGRGHSRRGHRRHRLHALRDDVHLDLVARPCKPILPPRSRGRFRARGRQAAQRSAPRCLTAARHWSTTTPRLRRPTPPGPQNSFVAPYLGLFDLDLPIFAHLGRLPHIAPNKITHQKFLVSFSFKVAFRLDGRGTYGGKAGRRSYGPRVVQPSPNKSRICRGELLGSFRCFFPRP
jgi:hypothetical protein